MAVHVKRRGRPVPGSITEALDSFRAGVRFYQEIAPVAGVRVPACYQAEDSGAGTMLVLEDLSAAPGVLDLAWLLLSSADLARWDEVIAAYGAGEAMAHVLPAVAVHGWLRRLDAAASLL